MKTMQAVVRYGADSGAFKLCEMPIPDIGPNDVLVKVAYAGVCGTDLHCFHATTPVREPVVQGHEFCGTVAAVGANVSTFKVDDRVVAESTPFYCGTCAVCMTGPPTLCRHARSYGYGRDAANGGFAEYALVPARGLHRIPDNASLRHAALTEPFGVSYQATLVDSGVTPGDTVLIIGPGSIGAMAVLSAKVAGAAEIIVAGTEGDDDRLALLKTHYGVTKTIDLTREGRDGALGLKDGYGADLVVDAAGPKPAFELALDAVRPCGRIVKIASCREPVEVNIDKLIGRSATLRGHSGIEWQSWENCLALLASGVVDVEPLITHEFPLSQWREALDLVESKQAMKVLLMPH